MGEIEKLTDESRRILVLACSSLSSGTVASRAEAASEALRVIDAANARADAAERSHLESQENGARVAIERDEWKAKCDAAEMREESCHKACDVYRAERDRAESEAAAMRARIEELELACEAYRAR